MLLRRLLLAAVVMLLTLLIAEAAHSLVTGRSLRTAPKVARLWPALALPPDGTLHSARIDRVTPAGTGDPGDPESEAAPLPPLMPATDAERHAAGPDSTGIYQMHEDARVGYVLKRDTELRIVESHTHTDQLGMRVRPGPPPPENALRIDVVGDSVAFGYGVEDDQTLAAHLERLLTDARGPDARSVACFTVAVPSWNHRNALAFLTDHWNDVHADIVLYLPIPNDLGDTGAIYESGKLRVQPDPFQPDPLLVVSRSLLAAIEENLDPTTTGNRADISLLGPYALESDLTPESSRRYDDNANSIIAMARYLAARRSKLLVVHVEQSQYAWHLDMRLRRLGPGIPLLYMEKFLPPEFTLIVDAHPSGATHAARANWIAADLLERGWVDRGAGLPLPEVPAANRALLGPQYTQEQVLDYSTRSREAMLAALLNEIDFTTGKGLRQVIGGLNIDRTVRMNAIFVLKADGPSVDLELGPEPRRGDLYPLEVDVELAGVPSGRVTIKALAVARAKLPLPPSIARGQAFEVLLKPATWCVEQQRERSQVVAFLPLRIACPEP